MAKKSSLDALKAMTGEAPDQGMVDLLEAAEEMRRRKTGADYFSDETLLMIALMRDLMKKKTKKPETVDA